MSFTTRPDDTQSSVSMHAPTLSKNVNDPMITEGPVVHKDRRKAFDRKEAKRSRSESDQEREVKYPTRKRKRSLSPPPPPSSSTRHRQHARARPPQDLNMEDFAVFANSEVLPETDEPAHKEKKKRVV